MIIIANNINIDNLSKAISDELKIYNRSVTEGMKEVIEKSSLEFKKDTKRDANKGRRKKYYKKIDVKKIYENSFGSSHIWYVKNPEYRLTHLLVKGHQTKKGGRTKANDFLSDNLEKLSKNLDKELKRVVENGH